MWPVIAGQAFGPLFEDGVTFASFQWSSTTPSSRDLMKMIARAGASSSWSSSSTHCPIPSGPAAPTFLSSLIFSRTSHTLNWTELRIMSVYISSGSGTVFVSSLVNRYLFKAADEHFCHSLTVHHCFYSVVLQWPN